MTKLNKDLKKLTNFIPIHKQKQTQELIYSINDMINTNRSREDLYHYIQKTKNLLESDIAILNQILKVYVLKLPKRADYILYIKKCYQETIEREKKYYELIAIYEDLYGYGKFDKIDWYYYWLTDLKVKYTKIMRAVKND